MIFLHDSICRRNYDTRSLSIEMENPTLTSIQTKNHKEGIIPTSYSAMSIVSMI